MNLDRSCKRHVDDRLELPRDLSCWGAGHADRPLVKRVDHRLRDDAGPVVPEYGPLGLPDIVADTDGHSGGESGPGRSAISFLVDGLAGHLFGDDQLEGLVGNCAVRWTDVELFRRSRRRRLIAIDPLNGRD